MHKLNGHPVLGSCCRSAGVVPGILLAAGAPVDIVLDQFHLRFCLAASTKEEEEEEEADEEL